MIFLGEGLNELSGLESERGSDEVCSHGEKMNVYGCQWVSD